MFYILKKDNFVSFGIILDEVNGGWRLPGKEMCRGKKWNCGGPPPCRALVETLNNYLNVSGYGSLGPLQPSFCREAACCRKVCLCTFPLVRKLSRFPPKEGRPLLTGIGFNQLCLHWDIYYAKKGRASSAGGGWEQPCQAQRGSQHQESCSFSLSGDVVAPRIGVRALWLSQQFTGGERYPQPPARLLLLSLHGLSRDPEVTKLLI